MDEKPVSVLHIEDDPLWSRLVESTLVGEPGLKACWQAATAAEGLALTRERKPDLVLLDLNLPDASGCTLADDLMLQFQPPRIILLTTRRDDITLFLANQPFISGLLWKNTQVAALLPDAVRAVMAGQRYFPPEVQAAIRGLRQSPDAFFKILTPKELELMPHFGGGGTDSDIAGALGLSVSATRSHRQRIMGKLGLHRSIDLMHWAIRTGLVNPPR